MAEGDVDIGEALETLQATVDDIYDRLDMLCEELGIETDDESDESGELEVEDEDDEVSSGCGCNCGKGE